MNSPQVVNRRRFRRRNKQSKANDEMDNTAVAPQAVTGSETTQRTVGKQKHERKEVTLAKERDLKALPSAVPLQLIALTKLIKSILKKHGISHEDIAKRNTIFQDFRQLLLNEIPDCTVQLYGSSLSGLGLQSSDINIDVHDDEEMKIPRIFMTVLNLLKSSGKYLEIKEEFQAKRPTINFTDFKSGLKCRVSTENNSSFLTSTLLKIYGQLDYRVQPLCVAFKHWAKICKVDRQAAGTLPSYSFILMVVHFLQQTNPPVLPVIHEKLGDVDIIKYISKQNSSEEMLKKIQGNWVTANRSCLGALWLGLLRYYSAEEYQQSIIINVTHQKRFLRSDKNWGKKNKFAIEDPFSTKRNVARTLSKSSCSRFVIEHLKLAFLYFGRFPTSVSPNDEEMTGELSQYNSLRKVDNGEQKVQITYNEQEENNKEEIRSESDECDDGDEQELVDGIFAMDTINDSLVSDDKNSGVDDDDDDDDDGDITDQSITSESSYLGKMPIDTVESLPLNSDDAHGDMPRTDDDPTKVPDLDWKNVQYVFEESVLRKGPPLESKCSNCGEDDHIADNCTVERKKVLKKLPNMTSSFNETLTNVCIRCKDDLGISIDEGVARERCKRDLEVFIQHFRSDATLHLFGSSCNGFGFHESDLDICMMFKGKKKDGIDCISTITALAKILRGNPNCRDVISITGAKVPIVKFFLKNAKREADISLYNEVALWNTKMLAKYVAIDRRVQVLGCTLKIFVKICDIGDASRGSLSSYAYILMLLHFLQQRDPPVLPVLQELYDTKEKPENIVEGFNCWFYDDLNNLGTKWKCRNTESCGELWLGFLRYFTETFDYNQDVVCVRTLKRLTKFEKLWHGKKICIEDPFVLTHNLGAGLSPTMARFILSAFEKAREHFGTPRRDIPDNIQQRQRFFFNAMLLNGGYMPPTGRNCNICRKIGHWAKECPYNKANRGQEGKKARKKTQKDKDNKVENNEVEDSTKVEQSQTSLKPDEHPNNPKPNNIVASSASPIPDTETKVIPPRQNMFQSSPPAAQFSPPRMAVFPISPPQMYRPPFTGGSPLSPNLPGHFAFGGRSHILTPSNIASSASPIPDRPTKVIIQPRQHMIPPTPPTAQFSPPRMAVFPSSPPQMYRPPFIGGSPLSPNLPGHFALGGRSHTLAPRFSQPSHSQGVVIPQLRVPSISSSMNQRTPIHSQFPNFSPNLSQASQNPFVLNSIPPPLMPVAAQTIPRAMAPNDFINSSSPDQRHTPMSPQPTLGGRYPPLIVTAIPPNSTVNNLSPNRPSASVSSQPISPGGYPELIQRVTAPSDFINTSLHPQQAIAESQTITRDCYAELIPTTMKPNDLMTPHSHFITCEALENQEGCIDTYGREQADGGSSNNVVQHPSEGFSPSVLQVLQSMNLSDHSNDQGQQIQPETRKNLNSVDTHAPKQHETLGNSDTQEPLREKRGRKNTPERFSTPPNVRNTHADELKDLSPNFIAQQEPENKNAKTRNKDIVVDLHDECENAIKKLATGKTEEPATFCNASVEDDDAKTAGSGNQRRNRRNRSRVQKHKEDKKNETLDGCAGVQQNDVGSTKRVSQHTEKQNEAKNPKAPIQNTRMQNIVRISTSSPPANSRQVKDKEVKEPSGQTNAHGKTAIDKKKETKATGYGGHYREKEVNIKPGSSAQVKDEPQNITRSAKAGETLIIKVAKTDERKVVVESEKDMSATPSNRRRRARNRRRNKPNQPEDSARRDGNNGARGGYQKNKATEIKD